MQVSNRNLVRELYNINQKCKQIKHIHYDIKIAVCVNFLLKPCCAY